MIFVIAGPLVPTLAEPFGDRLRDVLRARTRGCFEPGGPWRSAWFTMSCRVIPRTFRRRSIRLATPASIVRVVRMHRHPMRSMSRCRDLTAPPDEASRRSPRRARPAPLRLRAELRCAARPTPCAPPRTRRRAPPRRLPTCPHGCVQRASPSPRSRRSRVWLRRHHTARLRARLIPVAEPRPECGGFRAPHRAANRDSLAEGDALMAQGSGIEWTEATWNPVTGCTKVSPGCKHC